MNDAVNWAGPIFIAFANGAGFAAGLWLLGAVLALLSPDDDAQREWP